MEFNHCPLAETSAWVMLVRQLFPVMKIALKR